MSRSPLLLLPPSHLLLYSSASSLSATTQAYRTSRLSSLICFSGGKVLFSFSSSSSKHGRSLLRSQIVSVGCFVSLSFGKQSGESIFNNFRMTSFTSRASHNNIRRNDADTRAKDFSRSVQREAKVAFFDVDGTITRTNVVFAYYTHRITELPFIVKVLWIPWFAITCLFYLILDSINRAAFNRIFYLSYKGRSIHCKTQVSELVYQNYYRPRIFSGAVECIRKLKNEGYEIVFVTGCLDFLIAPLAQELGADFAYAAELAEENGSQEG